MKTKAKYGMAKKSAHFPKMKQKGAKRPQQFGNCL